MDCNYHSTKALLKEYRELEFVACTYTKAGQTAAIRETGTACYDSTYDKYIMFNSIKKGLDTLRRLPSHGEMLYKIIYYNYISPEIYYKSSEIIAQLKTDRIYLSERSYYRKKKQAISLLSEIIKSFC